MSNLEAATSNNRREALVRLRDSLASALDRCDPNMLPQLAGQYRATLAELDGIPEAEKVSTPAAIREQRAKRRLAVVESA